MADTKQLTGKETAADLHGLSLTSADILQQKFAVKFRGYDVQDVDSFLEVIAREMERLSQENARLSDELLSLRREIDQCRKKEESINSALVTVQKMVDDVKNNALQESEKMLAEAGRESERIVGETQESTRRQQEEISFLRNKAEGEARRILDEARQEAERMLAEAYQKTSARYEEADVLKEKAAVQSRRTVDE
ncbi:MAG: DivIVA domain-containing protein, partial [Pseudomonadota bacterium]